MRSNRSTAGGRTRRTAITTGAVGLAASITLAGCGAVAGSSAGGAGGDDGNDTFKVGVLASMTGSLAPYGPALERGIEVGVELINAAGGIGGQQVEYVVGDTQSEPRGATTQARKMLTQDDVDVLIGTTSSASTLAVIPLAEAAGVPFIYPAEGESKTCDSTGEAPLRYVFGAGVTPEQKMEAFVPYLLENIGDSVYFIGSDYVFPHFVNDLTADMVVEGGGTVVGTDYAPLGTTDFSSYIAGIDRADPEVIFISVVGADGVALVNQLNEFGLADRVELTGIPTFAAEALPGIAAEAQGVYTTDPYWEGLDNPVNEEFVEAYRAKFSAEDGPVSPMAAQGAYGTLLLLQAAAEAAGSTEGDALADALVGTTVDSPGGAITIAENHIVETPVQLIQVDGEGYSLVENLGTIAHPGFSGCTPAGS